MKKEIVAVIMVLQCWLSYGEISTNGIEKNNPPSQQTQTDSDDISEEFFQEYMENIDQNRKIAKGLIPRENEPITNESPPTNKNSQIKVESDLQNITINNNVTEVKTGEVTFEPKYSTGQDNINTEQTTSTSDQQKQIQKEIENKEQNTEAELTANNAQQKEENGDQKETIENKNSINEDSQHTTSENKIIRSTNMTSDSVPISFNTTLEEKSDEREEKINHENTNPMPELYETPLKIANASQENGSRTELEELNLQTNDHSKINSENTSDSQNALNREADIDRPKEEIDEKKKAFTTIEEHKIMESSIPSIKDNKNGEIIPDKLPDGHVDNNEIKSHDVENIISQNWGGGRDWWHYMNGIGEVESDRELE